MVNFYFVFYFIKLFNKHIINTTVYFSILDLLLNLLLEHILVICFPNSEFLVLFNAFGFGRVI